jgi:sulfur carrier protein
VLEGNDARGQNLIMQIVVNGAQREVPEGATLEVLLQKLGLDQRRVAVELNEQVVPKAHHAETMLKSSDRIEIVTFVGGG